MCQVILKVLTEDEDIVEKDKDEPPKVRKEQFVHGGLEGRGCIAEPEGHGPVLVVSLMSMECRLMDILGGHAYLMKTLGKIEFGEPACKSQIIQQFIDCGNRKSVLDSERI